MLGHIFMDNLFSLKFWFNLRPASLSPTFQNIFTGFVVVLIMATVAAGLIKKGNKKQLYGRFWSALYSFCLTNAIVGLILWFFNYEQVPFLSARFWFLLWAAEMIIWAAFIVKILLVVPKLKEQAEKEKEFKKYIP